MDVCGRPVKGARLPERFEPMTVWSLADIQPSSARVRFPPKTNNGTCLRANILGFAVATSHCHKEARASAFCHQHVDIGARLAAKVFAMLGQEIVRALSALRLQHFEEFPFSIEL
jgi:hypothetical protein